MTKKALIFLIIGVGAISSNEPEELHKPRHTLVLTGMAPLMIPIYNYGVSYDFSVVNSDREVGVSINLAAKNGFLATAANLEGISTSGYFNRADIGARIWRHVHSGDGTVGFFLGLSAAYVKDTLTVTYETNGTHDLGTQTYSRILPGYILGVNVKPSRGASWCAGFAIGGLFGSRVNATYQIPNDNTPQTKEFGSSAKVFLEFSVGYSF